MSYTIPSSVQTKAEANAVVARTFTMNGYNYGTISEPIDLTVSTSTMETPDGSNIVASFVMPELDDGTGILLSVRHDY